MSQTPLDYGKSYKIGVETRQQTDQGGHKINEFQLQKRCRNTRPRSSLLVEFVDSDARHDRQFRHKKIAFELDGS